ncbi:hypothetical protein YM18_1512 [Geobacter sulfurreducens]|nr:hypothetical protein YM18_1512 [Geobacter sulfurreducens]
MAYTIEDMAAVINADHLRLLKVIYLLMWIIFALFHIILLLIFLLVVWYFDYTTVSLYVLLQQKSQNYSVAKLVGLLSAVGFSILGALAAYVKIWTKIYSLTVNSYLMKEVVSE